MGEPEEKKPLESLEHKRGNNIKKTFKKQDGRTWTGLVWPRIRGGEHGDGSLGFLK